ncbi:MAG: hypothetical protein IIZ44_00520 [Muribaculaceae bacterium]|nr:hypothetical protein [Muribaculaceae bacterium]
MNKIQLTSCGVVFNEQDHTYTLEGKQLQGITGVLQRRLFPDKYADVDPEVLAKAAARGTAIHRYCQIYDELGIVTEGCEEVTHYAAMCKALDLVPVASEYLVTDGEHYASKIDAVYQGEKGVILNDRKTTYHLDKEYVSWQLSIYAWMFERMNPGVEVEGLTATWMREGICEYVGIDRKDASLVEALLQADINDEPFQYYPDADDVPDYISKVQRELANIDSSMKMLKARQDALKAEVLARMSEEHASTIRTELATFSRVAPSQKYVFDEKRFMENHRDIYDQYCTKLQSRKESLTIKFK